MNIGVRLHDTAPGTFEERLGFARSQGFSCIHLALSKVLPDFNMSDAPTLLNDALAARVREGLAANGLECAVLGCYLKLADPDAEALERTRDIYRAHLKFVKRMGASVVGTETPAAPGLGMDIHSEEALELFIRSIQPLARCAEEEGVILAVEPVACHIVNTPERAERVLDALRSDNVRIILDAVNLLTRDNYRDADAIIEDALRRFGDRVCVLHMKDYTVDPDVFMTVACACGAGGMNYDRLLRFAAEKSLPMTLENTNPQNAEAARLHLEKIAGGLAK